MTYMGEKQYQLLIFHSRKLGLKLKNQKQGEPGGSVGRVTLDLTLVSLSPHAACRNYFKKEKTLKKKKKENSCISKAM